MLAYMHQSSPLSGWAAFRPKRLSCDLQARPAGEALPEIVGRQMAALTRIYRLCRDDPDNAEWYRLEAFESCPGLIELWPQPFQAKYQAADGAVLIRFRNGPDGGIQMAADVTDK